MKHSCANVFCRRAGDRKGPVKNGESMTCESIRSLVIVPVPPHIPPMHPVTYDGTTLLPLSYAPVGGGAGDRGATPAGSNPARKPVTTLPGALPPGRPPRDTDHAS